ncbi:MAG: FAD-binding oxidoreductase [Candidatus Omnitrophota bacterium]
MVKLDLEIKEIIQRNYNVKSFRLDIKQEVDFKAGQLLSASLKMDKECKRYFSISSSPTEKCFIEFTKKITDSNFSKELNILKLGDIIRVEYPFGKFTLEDNPAQKVAFISGGIGITPIRSIIKYAVDKNLDIDIALIYANRSIRDVIFKEDFDYMQKKFRSLKVSHVLCEPTQDFKCSIGLVNETIIKNEISDYLERKFFLCGPPQMVSAMKKILAEKLNITQENIVTENFVGY